MLIRKTSFVEWLRVLCVKLSKFEPNKFVLFLSLALSVWDGEGLAAGGSLQEATFFLHILVSLACSSEEEYD